MVTTCPGPALRSSLYAVLIRDSAQPFSKRVDGETTPPAQRRARDGAPNGGGVRLRGPSEMDRLELNARRNV